MAEAFERVARWRPGDDVAPLRALVARGGVLAIPTESSYGLAVDPRSRVGVERIYALKERERGKPLPVVAADVEQVVALGLAVAHGDDGEGWPPLRAVASAWPAPLTLVLPLGPGVEMPAAGGASDLRTSSSRTLAVRVPAHDLLRELLAAVGSLTATSANRAGEPPILDPAELDALFESSAVAASDVVIVDGGVLDGGAPSTLIRWDDAASRFDVLRAGRYPVADLPAVSAD